ncbi:hypothetical protein A8C56_05970 [Niabella ginsenosidivorans]|uniref:DUF306 domain-containing protein n=1 Tax=Niabella ginsenosidivorans TaxID=1176587 RepID=A0A1A9I1L0_9BACT|nr:META domain-containing protein [Niabella ginsenosidivorans]ANH80591.1 hypothetical protein A8C56_05970 [Niabella ginsenosidivorans]
MLHLYSPLRESFDLPNFSLPDKSIFFIILQENTVLIIQRYLWVFVTLTALAAGSCASKAPLQSTFHTEALHHKWKITALKDFPLSMPYAFLDLRNVYHSTAAIGCDTLSVTPRLGYNRIELDDRVSAGGPPNCTDSATRSLFIKQLADVYTYKVTATRLELLDRKGATVLQAEIDPEDEKGSLNRRWAIVKMINVTSDSFNLLDPFIDLTDLTRAHAFAGCNQLRFQAKAVAPYSLSFSKVAGTRKYCKAAMEYESILTKALPLVTKYQVIGNRLKLFDKENVLLLEGRAALNETGLSGASMPVKSPLNRQWMLTGMEGFTKGELIKAKASIDLTDLQHAGSKVGCNTIRLTAIAQPGNRVQFTNLSSTKMYCAPFMKLEAACIEKLEQVRVYTLEGHRIQLKDSAGNLLIEAVAADWD